MVEVADEGQGIDIEEESMNDREDEEETVSPWIRLEARVSTVIEPHAPVTVWRGNHHCESIRTSVPVDLKSVT